LNEGLGGSIELGEYLFPVELPAEKTKTILEDQAEDYGHDVRDSTNPYFSIKTGDDTRYDLLYTNKEEDEGVKAVAEYDEAAGETQGFWKVDDLLEEETDLDSF
jgi:hypothetical protein